MPHSCVSHYVKASDLEQIVLKSVQAVSDFVLDDREGFISQLQTEKNDILDQQVEEDKAKLSAMKKRVADLDHLIQGLYEDNAKGILPQRQYFRLMEQYNSEQENLLQKISEIEAVTEKSSGPKKVDVERFIALVDKYQRITELTDKMLYEFIDHIDVHQAQGGRSIYRYQEIDVYFNFIGQYTAPSQCQTEDERNKLIRQAAEEKYAREKKRAVKQRAEKLKDYRQRAAEGDPEAAAWLEHFTEVRRENNRRGNAKAREKRQICELEKIADSDPAAADVLQLRRKRNYARNQEAAEKRRRKRKEYIQSPEYLRQKEKRDHLAELRKLKICDLEKLVDTDPDAAGILEKQRSIDRTANRRNYGKRKAEREANPEYQRKKAEAERLADIRRKKIGELETFAETDPMAAAVLEDRRRRNRISNQKKRKAMKAEKEADPEYQRKKAERMHLAGLRKMKITELEALADSDPDARDSGGHFPYERIAAAVFTFNNGENSMSYHRSKYEKETIILTNEADDYYSVYTFNCGLKKKLGVFSKKYPELCCLEDDTGDGGFTFKIQKSRVSIRLIPPYSEERRRRASECVKKNRIEKHVR